VSHRGNGDFQVRGRVGTLHSLALPYHFTIQLYESCLRGTGEAGKAGEADELDTLVSNTYRALMTHVIPRTSEGEEREVAKGEVAKGEIMKKEIMKREIAKRESLSGKRLRRKITTKEFAAAEIMKRDITDVEKLLGASLLKRKDSWCQPRPGRRRRLELC